MKPAEMTVKQLKRRKRISATAAFLLSVLPVSVVILSKWKLYVSHPAQVFALGAGGIMVGVVVVLSILGRLKISGDVWALAFTVALLFLLKSFMDDLLLLSFTLLCGRVGDKLLTAAYVKRISRELEAREAAERAGKTVIDGVKSYLEGNKV